MRERNKIKYILYARKSSEGDDRQVQSIDNQKEVLEKLADRLGLNIVERLEDSKSAKLPFQRKDFTKMLELIEKGKADGILCWQLNRLSRNPAESGLLQQMLQDEKIKSIQTYDREYTPTDNAVIFSVEASIGNQFIIDHKKNVKRGMAYKRSHGGIAGPAPEGYENYIEKNVRLVRKDPKRFPLIQKAFHLFLTGNYTVPEIQRIMNENWGYTTVRRKKVGGNPISRASIYYMFRNPRYAGLVPDPYDESKSYKGSYPRMITLEEYDDVQELLGKRGCPRLATKRKFSLRGFIRCGECGCMITAEKKKKKLVAGGFKSYTYYHCTGKRPCNQKGSIREEKLSAQVYELIDNYELPSDLYEWGVKALNELAKEEVAERDDIQAMQFKSIDEIQKKLDNLLNLAEFGSITPEKYKERSTELTKELKKRQREQAKTAKRVQNWYEIVGKTLELLKNANHNFVNGDVHDKQEILLAIGQNPVLLNKQLSITPNEWLTPVKNGLPALKAQIDEVRTKPDKIKNDPEGSLLNNWYSILSEVRTLLVSDLSQSTALS